MGDEPSSPRRPGEDVAAAAGEREPAPGAAGAPASRPFAWLLGVVLIALTLVAFAPVVNAEFLNWDDFYLLQYNADYNPVRAASVASFWTRTRLSFYIPVAYTLWAGGALLGQTHDAAGHLVQDPRGFHPLNLLLHVVCVVLVYGLLRKLLGDGAREQGTEGGHEDPPARRWISVCAAAGAALFAVHPIQV